VFGFTSNDYYLIVLGFSLATLGLTLALLDATGRISKLVFTAASVVVILATVYAVRLLITR
jgi:hypothetical protein